MEGASTPMPRRPTSERWALVAVTLWSVLCFAPTLGFGFVSWDDALHLTRNPLVVDPSSQPWTSHLLTPALGYPSPVTVLSYRFEAALFGLDSALPFHATNVLLHAGVVALVFLLARSLGLSVMGSAFAATLFALHPVAAEPVSWVSGRKDMLAAVLGLGALYVSGGRQVNLRKPRGWAALCLFVLALLAKPVAAYLALVIPVWSVLGCRPGEATGSSSLQTAAESLWRRWRSALVAGLPFLVASAIVFPVAWRGQVATSSLRTDLSPVQLLRDAWFALGFHLRLLLGLDPPTAKYLPEHWPAPFTPQVDLVPVIVIAALALVTWRAAPEARARALAGLTFAGCAYLPTSNLIPLARVLADVYVFMPLVGLAWWAAAVLEPLLERLPGSPLVRALPVLGAAIGLTLAVLPASARWRNSVSLWGQAFERYPHDYRLCRNLGNARFELQGPEAALKQYEVCAQRFGMAPFRKNIGLTLEALGERAPAMELLQEVSSKQPDDPVVRRTLQRLRSQGRTAK